MTATPAPQSKLVSWFWATRPFSLSASVAPVLVGTALAATVGALDWLLFALALTGSVAIQIGTNLTDEYSDHRKSGSEGKFLAPHKVIQRGLLSERAVALGMAAAFGYGAAAGLTIVALLDVGWPILAVGLASVAAAYLYAGGPKPLGTLGLGEPVVFVFMGPLMVMASYYVQQEALTLGIVLRIVAGRVHRHGDPRGEQHPRRGGGPGGGKAEPRHRRGNTGGDVGVRGVAGRGVPEHRRRGAGRGREPLGAAGARAAAVGSGSGAVRCSQRRNAPR